MKKNDILATVPTRQTEEHGESYYNIFRYFLPEFITTLIVYTMPFWIDAVFIGSLNSVATYTTLGIANNFIHTLIKIAEALSVGTVVLSGKYHGQGAYENAGKVLVDAFWLTTMTGLFFSCALYFGAEFIYAWYDVSPDIIALGIPFLRVRAIGVFCMFIYFALVGFMRGMKDTKTPMKIFLIGSVLFVFFDYVLIFGKFGFPMLGLQGSGIATCLQYVVMMIASIWYIVMHPNIRRYGIELLKPFVDIAYVKHLIKLSIPIVFDKTAMAFAYVWLGKMMGVLGTASSASFYIVRDMERFAFIPALACAQVITFLVSNDAGASRFVAIRNNIKKIIMSASVMVGLLLVIFAVYAQYISALFDKSGTIANMAAQAFPLISIFVFFDLLQLILAGALRGTGNVYVVMGARMIVGLFFFGPCSYMFTHYVAMEEFPKFVTLYSIFYISNALMTMIYMYWLNGDEWQKSNH